MDKKVPCDHCGEYESVVYCKADSARLCIFCDRVVHSANPLASKHARSRLCDNCKTAPVAAGCATDGLLLCQECDCDAHESSSLASVHDRLLIDGFTGCPSALKLAALWDFDIAHKAHLFSLAVSDSVPLDQKQQREPRWERHKQGMYQQLMELLRRDLACGATAELKPPTRKGGLGGETQMLGLGGSFTSLLTMQGRVDSYDQNNQRLVEEESFLWEFPNTDQTSQMWDFNSGASRDVEKTEVGNGTDDRCFMLKYNNDFCKDASFTATCVLEDLYDTNCGSRNEDLSSNNNQYITSPEPDTGTMHSLSKWQDSSVQPAKQGATPSGIDTSPLARNNTTGKDTHIGEQTLVIRPGSVKYKANMELLAENRGNAMRRYKEKRKIRRQYPF